MPNLKIKKYYSHFRVILEYHILKPVLVLSSPDYEW